MAATMKAIAFAAPLLALLSAPAAAEEAASSGREEAAWRTAYAMQGDMLAPDQQSDLLHLAWHAAAANLCGPLILDHETFGEAYAGIEHSDMSSLSDAEHEYFRHHLAVSFGVAVGIMLAEHAGTPDEIAAFCSDAIDYATDPEAGSYFDREALGSGG